MFQGYLRRRAGWLLLAEETDTSIALYAAPSPANLLMGEPRVIVLGRTHD